MTEKTGTTYVAFQYRLIEKRAMTMRTSVRCLALCIALALPATLPLHAQAQTQIITIHIEEGTLSSAIAQLAAKTGLVVYMDASLTDGLTTSGLTGEYSVDEALTKILSGSGLQAIQEDDGSYRITAARGLFTFAPITVGAKRLQGSSYGPINGYVPQRSATATKSDTALLEVPQAISVVGKDTIKTRGTESVNHSLRYSAGVQPFANFDTTSDLFHVRGIENDNGIFLDGTQQRVNRFDSIVDPYGLERIEVLKGPSSVLYGGNSPGGLVNLISKRPQAKSHGELGVQLGSYDRTNLTSDFGGSLSDTLTYRLVALNRESDSQVDFIGNDRLYIAPSIAWDISDQTSLTLLSYYQEDETDFAFGLPATGTLNDGPRGAIPSHRFTGEPGFNGTEREHFSLSSILEHSFTDQLSFRQHLRYFDSNADRNEMWDINLLGIFPYDSSGGVIYRLPFSRTQHSDSFTADNQLLWQLEGDQVDHQILAGIDYRRTRFDQQIDTDLQVLLNPTKYALDLINPSYGLSMVTATSPYLEDNSQVRQLGIYLQDQIAIQDHWLLTLSGRHDRVETDTTSATVSTSTGSLNPAVSRSTEDSEFTGRVGFTYLADTGLAPYVSYSESFLPVAGLDSAGNALEPELGKQYEMGIKFQPAEGDTLVTLSVFDLTRENVVTTSPDGLVKNQYGEVQSKGIELEAARKFDNGINLTAAYTYTDAEVTKSLRTFEEGLSLVRVPKNTASLWVEYVPQTADLKGLSVGLGVRYVDDTFDQSNTVNVPSYTLFDASLGYRWKDWELALTANNLFDKEYLAHCSSAIHATGAVLSSSCSYGQRQQINLGIRYLWGE